MEEQERMARQAQGGDQDAFVALMEACKPSLLRAARAILQNEEDVADAMQDTVLDAWQKLGDLRKPKYVKTWLTRILINNCYDALRRRKLVALGEFPPEESVEYDWDSSLDVRERLELLNGKDRLLLVLFYVEDMSQRQIAQALGISENAVKQRLHRAKKRFRQVYEEGAAING